MERQNTKYRQIFSIVMVIPLFLALVCFLIVIAGNHQSSLPIPMPQTFHGEYSYDGEQWEPLTENTDLPADKGELFLRGHMERAMEEGILLWCFRDHIGISMAVNGETVFADDVTELSGTHVGLFTSMCGREWTVIRTPGITPEDTVEFRLFNPHRWGNRTAYRTFLDTMCGQTAGADILEENLERYGTPYRSVGTILMVAAFMLLGAALVSAVIRDSSCGKLFRFGMLTLFAGGCFILDAIDISFHNQLIVMNTYGGQLCRMFAVFFAGYWIVDGLSGRRRIFADIAMMLSALYNSVLLLLSFTGVTVIYDTLPAWTVSQLILCPVLIVCCVLEMTADKCSSRIPLLAGILVLAAVPADAAGLGYSLLTGAVCFKSAFLLLFGVSAVFTARKVVMNHAAADHARKLEKELEDSRVSIMLSQIQPHFLYNVLGTIRGLCREDPEKAWTALGDFSGYLRGNMSALTNSQTIPFTGELKHIETYLRLEKMRMGERLNIVYDIREKNFFLPPLTVQPLVENAVKHGLFDKPGSGTLILHTERDGDKIIISVQDDGVGFSPDVPAAGGESTHIGIANVRSRLDRLSDGQLILESTPGAGTTATVILHNGTEGDGKENADAHTGS